MWRFTDADLRRRIDLVESALDAGLNLIDTADVYGLDWNSTGFGTVETALGEVLQQRPEFRERMVLATRVASSHPPPMTRRRQQFAPHAKPLCDAFRSTLSTSIKFIDRTCSCTLRTSLRH